MSYGHGNTGPKRRVVEVLGGWACTQRKDYSRKVKLECGHIVAQRGKRCAMVDGDYSSRDIRNLKTHKTAYCHICGMEGK